MSVLTLPTVVSQTIGSFVIGQRTYEMEDISATTGDSAVRVLAPPRWTLSMVSIDTLTPDQSAEWEAFAFGLRGGVNRLAVWDVSRPAPRGTMRGTLTLSASAALGATTLSITGGGGQAGKTLLAGDWLQIGTGLGTSQYVKVIVGGTANGSGVVQVQVEPPIRVAFSNASPVVWDKPVCHFKSLAKDFSYSPNAGSLTYSGHSFDLIESWT